jgi:hypothetical protein
MTNEQHNKFVGIAFLAHAGFQMLLGLLFAFMFGGFMFMIPDVPGKEAPPRALFLVLASFFFVFQAIFAVPSFVAAYAVLKRKTWARIAGIVAAAISAMNVPVGTAACVYALWFFCGDNWKSVYQTELGGERAQLPHDSTAWANQPWEARREQRVPPTPPDWR